MKLSEMGHLLRPAAKRIPVNPQFLSGQPPEDRFVHDIAMPALPRLFQQAVELFKPPLGDPCGRPFERSGRIVDCTAKGQE